MKQLHLANIANVAYGYGKILRGIGVQADVLCYDLTHILSLPEWVEGDFDAVVQDEWHPDLSRPEITSISLPEWYRRVRSQEYRLSMESSPAATFDRQWIEAVVRASNRYGPRWTIRHEDIVAYQPLCQTLEAHFFRGYDLIFGYAYGAVPPLLTSLVPYVPVEIGTLRDTVNIDSPLGRLLGLAYRTAPHTIITNADCISSARALDLQNYSYVPHPVDEDVFRPLPPDERLDFRHRLGASKYLLIAPARQAWEVKANDRYLRAFGELVRAGFDATLLIAEWGPDVPRAKALIEELGVTDNVRWFSPAPERRLAKMLAVADLVLDQFGTFGTFGLIAPKAMACGTPCMLSFDPGVHSWCFEEIPPLIAAREESEIFQGIKRYLSDPAELQLCGLRSRGWVIKHHGKGLIGRKIERIADAVLSATRPRVGFDELRSQRLKFDRLTKRRSPGRLESTLSAAAEKIRKARRCGPVLREIIARLRNFGATNRRITQIEQAMKQLDQAMQSGLSRLEQELASQSTRSHQEVMNAFGVMGQNRLNDSIAITKIRNELLESMVRARLALPPNKNTSATVPRLRTALSLSEACLKLEQAAPLNWKTYIECLDRGTASYESFPPGSCSTETHPQAELFRAFLRPYLRGQVLDIGCGPQPVPSYLRDHPLSQISGIDPISAPSDHPFSFVPGYGEFLPWENEQFDVAVSGTSLDHYYLLDVGLAEAFRVLKQGGHFVAWITEFEGTRPYDPYSTAMISPYDSEHLYHIDRAWFLPLMSKMGFIKTEILHFELPFNYLFMSFEKPDGSLNSSANRNPNGG